MEDEDQLRRMEVYAEDMIVQHWQSSRQQLERDSLERDSLHIARWQSSGALLIVAWQELKRLTDLPTLAADTSRPFSFLFSFSF